MLKFLGIAVIMATLLGGAAYTKPSRDDLHAAASDFAGKTTFVGSVATDLTGLFGNDTFDDYIFFTRYRVYVGKDAKVDCFGAFKQTTCSMPKPQATPSGS